MNDFLYSLIELSLNSMIYIVIEMLQFFVEISSKSSAKVCLKRDLLSVY